MQHIVVREYARLTTAKVAPSLDQAQLSTEDFDWLCDYSARVSSGGASLVHLENRRWLRLDNYVGVLETPSGTLIEILPKHADGVDEVRHQRALLIRMLSRITDISPRVGPDADISALRWPLTEWIISRFLASLDRLIKRGLRFDYRSVREESRFIRGRLDMQRQLRQPPGRGHYFQIEHDMFSPDGLENRLLKSALRIARDVSRSPKNWALGHGLWQMMEPVPESSTIARDLPRWRDDRLMSHYRGVRPWCEMILRGHIPVSQHGKQRGISLLFPMEELFERYVASCLQRQLAPGFKLVTQAASESLCTHEGSSLFRLKPDLLVKKLGKNHSVLDTKWKRISSRFGSSAEKYGLSQSDFYQLFAYGEKYLDGLGDLYLVYPETRDFTGPLQVFEFSDDLRLWVVPFSLDREELLIGGCGESSSWYGASGSLGTMAKGVWVNG